MSEQISISSKRSFWKSLYLNIEVYIFCIFLLVGAVLKSNSVFSNALILYFAIAVGSVIYIIFPKQARELTKKDFGLKSAYVILAGAHCIFNDIVFAIDLNLLNSFAPNKHIIKVPFWIYVFGGLLIGAGIIVLIKKQKLINYLAKCNSALIRIYAAFWLSVNISLMFRTFYLIKELVKR